MSKFKIGDRVVCYAGKRKIATITSVDAGKHCAGPIAITYQGESGKCTEFVHPKQCRRLIKKPRRRIWVNPEIYAGVNRLEITTYFTTTPTKGYLEFIEVKRK